MTVCYRCIVTGRVQGVFFRGTTQHEARKLGLTGYAKNLPDGAVEVFVCGDEPTITKLREWLWLGPPAASVKMVDCQQVDLASPDDFSTL